MDSIIETFHLDWKLFLAQAVNFGIVVFVLWKFAFKPLVKKMDERTKMIEDSYEKTKSLEQEQKDISILKDKIIFEARQESKKIIDEAGVQAKKYDETMKSRTHNEAAKILSQAKDMIMEEKNNMMNQVKAEASELVILAVQKVLQEKITPEMDKKLSEKAVAEIIKSK